MDLSTRLASFLRSKTMSDFEKQGTCVFVGGLSNVIKKEDLESKFGKFGNLNNVWVASKPPGFAFVEFTNLDDAETARSNMNGTEMLGSKLRVEISHRRGRSRSRGSGRASRNKVSADRYKKGRIIVDLKKQGTYVYVGGLSDAIKKEDLESEFGKFGNLNNVWVASNPPGFAFIEFINLDDAKTACSSMNGTEMLGSKLRVEISHRHGRSRMREGERASRSKSSVGRYRRRGGYNNEGGDRYHRKRGSSSSRTGHCDDVNSIQDSYKGRDYNFGSGDDYSNTSRGVFHRGKNGRNRRASYDHRDYNWGTKGCGTDYNCGRSPSRRECHSDANRAVFYKTRVFVNRKYHNEDNNVGFSNSNKDDRVSSYINNGYRQDDYYGSRSELCTKNDNCNKTQHHNDNGSSLSAYCKDYNDASNHSTEQGHNDAGRGNCKKKGKRNWKKRNKDYKQSSSREYNRNYNHDSLHIAGRKRGSGSKKTNYSNYAIPSSTSSYGKDYNYDSCHSYRCDCSNIFRDGFYKERDGRSRRFHGSSQHNSLGCYGRHSYRESKSYECDFLPSDILNDSPVIKLNRLISSCGQVTLPSVEKLVGKTYDVEKDNFEHGKSTSAAIHQLNQDNNKAALPGTEYSFLEETTELSVCRKKCNISESVDNHIETIKESQDTSFMAERLPHLVLRHIFSFLCLEDLMNIQKVCTSWNDATMDSFVWKNVPVDLDLYGLQILQFLPYVYAVVGSFKNGDKLLDALLNNVEDLREVDWVVGSSYSLVKFEKFIKKFHNLEHITLRNYIHDFLESLNILATCPNLKRLSFLYRSDLVNFQLGCQIIENGFPSLTALNLTRKQGEGRITALSSMLEKKIHQLKELKLKDEICPNVLKLIFNSKKLEKFEMRIFKWPEIVLDMSCMNGLKSLNITVLHDFPPSSESSVNCPLVDVYRNIVFPPNLEYLEMEFPSGVNPHFDVISNVVTFLSQLRSLILTNIDDIDLNQQLENINNLQNLQTLTLYSCKNLSSKGVEYIAKCQALRKLEVSHVFLANSTYEYFKKCTYLGNLTLHSCILKPDKLLEAILEMKYLTHIYTYDCRYLNEKNELIFFDQNVINSILCTCIAEKHYVNIIF